MDQELLGSERYRSEDLGLNVRAGWAVTLTWEQSGEGGASRETQALTSSPDLIKLGGSGRALCCEAGVTV